MSYVKGLKCRECGKKYAAEPIYYCEFCMGPLEVEYDYAAVKAGISRAKIEAGPLSLWRYRDLLPVDGGAVIDIGTGLTPLVRANNLGRELGLANLFIKNDTINPTFSFKDRVVSVALSKAREFGFDTVACASTGNLANSVAAHAAHGGFRAFVFMPADLERGKIASSAVYDPVLVTVRGSYDDVNRLCSQISSESDWAFVNVNLRPYYAEGSKTLGFETVEQLGWRAPDHVVVPVASGSLLTKIHKGINEFVTVGLIDKAQTKVSGAQSAGCAPVSDAFNRGSLDIKPVKPAGIAKSLNIGNPADGYYALKTVSATGGFIEDVTDGEIVEGVNLLARTEGIFAETAGGVTIAVLAKLAKQGKIAPAETVVAYVTGAGLKTLEAVEDSLTPPVAIEPTLQSFKDNLIAGQPNTLAR